MKLNLDILRQLPIALRVEIEENARRKPLTQSELAVEQRHILAELRKHKKPGERTDLKGTSAKVLTEVRATALVGKLFNESHTQVEKRFAIVDAAKAEPKRFNKLLDDMDRTGRVNGVFKRLRVAQQAAQILAEPPPLPGRGPYRVMVADPPWPFEVRSEDPSHRATASYPQMSLAQICKMDVASIAAPDSILWLWTTNFHMFHGAQEVLAAWGFKPITILTWAKDKMGIGKFLRGQTEHCILAIRGKPVVTLTNQTTLLHAPARAHSQKPTAFYDLVESLCPAPRYAYLFSRYRHNERWDVHGNEAPPAMEPAS